MDNEDYLIIKELLEECKNREWLNLKNNCENIINNIEVCNAFEVDNQTKRLVDLITDCCNDCEEVIYRILMTIDECHKYVSKKN